MSTEFTYVPFIDKESTNVLTTSAQAILVPVNAEGRYPSRNGRTSFLQEFASRYPKTWRAYQQACVKHEFPVGTVRATQENGHTLILASIQERADSFTKLSDVENCLRTVAEKLPIWKVTSLACQKVGCSSSSRTALDWGNVGPRLAMILGNAGVDVFVHIGARDTMFYPDGRFYVPELLASMTEPVDFLPEAAAGEPVAVAAPGVTHAVPGTPAYADQVRQGKIAAPVAVFAEEEALPPPSGDEWEAYGEQAVAAMADPRARARADALFATAGNERA